jgi:hypothetical protein
VGEKRVSRQVLSRWFVGVLASIVPLLALDTAGAPASFDEPGYSIRYVSVTPKRGTRLRVLEHVVLTVTVAYELTVADKGLVTLVLVDDNAEPIPGQKQVSTWVSRGSDEVTLEDKFDVPLERTKSVRLCVSLVPQGYSKTSGECIIEYPVSRRFSAQ